MDLLYSYFPFLVTPSWISNSTAIVQSMMRFFASLLLGSLAFRSPCPHNGGRDAEFPSRSVDTFIALESPIAMAAILCNIGATGACSLGADPGIVIASPEKVDPNCRSTLP